MPTTYWSPNQAAIAQVETYTFSAPNGVGNQYIATINGKSVTYSSISGDTAALAATGLFNLLNATTSVPIELREITFANPSAGVVTATAQTPGTPFANVTINGVSGQGLVLSTGNGLANGITTAHTTANKSPSDVADLQNWLRVIGSAAGVRAIPVTGDDVIVSGSNIPLLWNLDHLIAVEFATYNRWQSQTGEIGLPEINPAGYDEWRQTYFRFSGPQGSVPSGGLAMVLGYDAAGGSGPSRERYNLGSNLVTLTVLATGSPQDEYAVRFLGVHTQNTIKTHSGVSLGVATTPGEVSNILTCTVDNSNVGFGTGVTWTAASTLTMYSGNAFLNSAPASISMNNSAFIIFATTGVTWPLITAQGGSGMSWPCGGVITSLTMTTGCVLDKSQDVRTLTITNATIDGDTCSFNDPLNAIVWTNPVSVKQQVSSGPFKFTGTRTVRVV